MPRTAKFDFMFLLTLKSIRSPIPDPEREKKKKLLVYDPSVHDYSQDGPVWEEILPGHFVWGNQKELEGYRKRIEEGNF